MTTPCRGSRQLVIPASPPPLPDRIGTLADTKKACSAVCQAGPYMVPEMGFVHNATAEKSRELTEYRPL